MRRWLIVLAMAAAACVRDVPKSQFQFPTEAERLQADAALVGDAGDAAVVDAADAGPDVAPEDAADDSAEIADVAGDVPVPDAADAGSDVGLADVPDAWDAAGDADAGQAVCSSADDCDDGNPCTDEACNPATGCVITLNTKACTDGNACTTGDTCANKSCVGKALDCNDGDACTTDSCVPASGCKHVAVVPVCGDGECSCTETASSCAPDCVASGCGDGVCDGDETAPNCMKDCGFLLARLGAACTTPGTSDTCGDGFFCVARSAAGGGNVCVADFETWAPMPDAHPASDFQEFTDYVKDNRTGLLWAKEALPGMVWSTALTACTTKTYGGFNDWRVPTRAELFSLADRSKVNPACSAPNVVIPNDVWSYWSAVPWASGGIAWLVSFSIGHADITASTGTCRVRCVR